MGVMETIRVGKKDAESLLIYRNSRKIIRRRSQLEPLLYVAPSDKGATSYISDDAEKQLASWQRGFTKRVFLSHYRNGQRDDVHALSCGLFMLIVASVPGCASNFKALVGPE